MKKKQSKKIVIEVNKKTDNQILEEGLWTDLKYQVGKLGSLEAHGKLKWFGGKKKQDMAYQQLADRLDDASQKMVKDFAGQMEKNHPEFPNNREHQEFLGGVIDVATFYDSLGAAVDKYKPDAQPAQQPKDAMAPSIANKLIESLKMWLVTSIDSKLSDVYKHFKEHKEKIQALLEKLKQEDPIMYETVVKKLKEKEENKELINELFGFGKKKGPAEPQYVGAGGAERAKDQQAAVGKTGKGEDQVVDPEAESKAMKGMKSRWLQIIMGALGGGMIGTAEALHALYYASRVPMETVSTTAETITAVENTVEAVDAATIAQDFTGSGLLRNISQMAAEHGGGGPMEFAKNIKAISQATGMDPDEIFLQLTDQGIMKQGNAGAEFMKSLFEWEEATGGSVGKVINSGSISPDFLQHLEQTGQTGILDIVKKFGQGAASGSPKFPGTILGVNPKAFMIGGTKFVTVATEVIKTTGVSMGVKKGTLVLGKLGLASTPAAATILSMGGWALAAGGVAISLARLKGRKSSRLSILEKLKGELKYFEDKVGTIVPPLNGHKEEEEEEGGAADPRGCQELMSKINGYSLRPGDVLELNFAASKRQKGRKTLTDKKAETYIKDYHDSQGNLKSRRVMVLTVPDGAAQIVGYKMPASGVKVDPYEQQCAEHPHWIGVQVIDITRAGDPPSLAPIAEMTKDDSPDMPDDDIRKGMHPRISSNNMKKLGVAETGKVPEGYSYTFNVKNVDKSDQAFEDYLEEFRQQIIDKRGEGLLQKFKDTIEAEIRRRRGKEAPEGGETQAEPTPPEGTEAEPTPPEGTEAEPTPPEGGEATPSPSPARRRRSRRRRGLPRTRRLYREGQEKENNDSVLTETYKRWTKLANIKGEE